MIIYAQGKKLNNFVKSLLNNPPPYATIVESKISYTRMAPFEGFSIQKSRFDKNSRSGFILPDLRICPECLKELFSASNRRFLYPFINCTRCGPRYTIIFNLPYDRQRTTMRNFPMCKECKKEYSDPANRRFHAEPIACPECGPEITLLTKEDKVVTGDIIKTVCKSLLRGKILAIKGLGGFHLACDATNDQAVTRLRKLKERGAKPFALMADSFDTVKLICEAPETALAILTSYQAPILLLPKRERPALSLSPAIAPGNGYLGVMLPYTPLHLLIFDSLKRLTREPVILVMTSANPSDEPIAIDEEEILKRKPPISDLILTHNRPIANRCDDSVVALDQEKTVMIRRARGYVLQPLLLSPMFHVKHPTLAMGGDGRNAFALGSGELVQLSPHIGNLETARSQEVFIQTLNRMITWTGIVPRRIVCDLHPDYISVRLAEQLSQRFDARLVKVQHHFAHLLGVMAEHNIQAPALGIAADGTGYGIDGAIWGCEFILIHKGFTWERVGHLGYLQHNAGAGMIADPVKLATQYLWACGIEAETLNRLNLNPEPVPKELPITTSSLGRLFDAVAAITGICRQATFEGEPAIALEAAARRAKSQPDIVSEPDDFLTTHNQRLIINPIPILKTVVELKLKSEDNGKIALWFHRIMIQLITRAGVKLCRRHRIKRVLLAGGSFQNQLLREGVSQVFLKFGLEVYYPRQVPLNDGGLALGQAVVR